jgi:hypothetical protein
MEGLTSDQIEADSDPELDAVSKCGQRQRHGYQ